MATSTRDEVLAYIDATGCGAADASRHFGGTPNATLIRKWLSRRRDAVTPGRDEAKKPAGPSKAPPQRQTPGLTRATTPAAALSVDARSRLRLAVEQQLEFLSDPTTIKDQKGRASAARALDQLLARCPDILTFDERTSGRMDGDGAARRNDAVQRVRGLLGAGGPGDG